MASFAFTDGVVKFGATDLSDWVVSVSYNDSAELLDDTNMGDTSRQRIKGLLDGSTEITFTQDFASNGPDDAVADAGGVGSSVTLTLQPTSAAVSATNPEWTGSATIESYQPISGTVGEKATCRVVLQGRLTRETS